jgi:hypothetical protein
LEFVLKVFEGLIVFAEEPLVEYDIMDEIIIYLSRLVKFPLIYS